jgi:hypothetical protein
MILMQSNYIVQPPSGEVKSPLPHQIDPLPASQIPPQSGWLDGWGRLEGGHPTARFVSMPAAVGTPKGLPYSSRGQGHAFCARRPRIASLPILPTPKGSNGSAPLELGVGAVPEPPLFSLVPIHRSYLRLLTVFPLQGT